MIKTNYNSDGDSIPSTQEVLMREIPQNISLEKGNSDLAEFEIY